MVTDGLLFSDKLFTSASINFDKMVVRIVFMLANPKNGIQTNQTKLLSYSLGYFWNKNYLPTKYNKTHFLEQTLAKLWNIYRLGGI